MESEPPKRTARRPKSYRGCKACKTARKKCSEAKPQCAFCVRNGLTCEYDIDFIMRFETFVNGKQPRRRFTSKTKRSVEDRAPRKGSADSTSSEDSTPSSEFISCNVDLLPICKSDTPDLGQLNDPFDNPELVLYTRLPSFFERDPEDMHYLQYFLTTVKVILPYFSVFPTMVSDIFVRAIADRGLFHSVLSVSHLIADSRSGLSLRPAMHHQTLALALLQEAISATQITESLAIAVAMLAWINIIQSNRPALSQHLQGLYLIFQEIQNRGQPPSPLLMQIWRFSIRLDLLATTCFFPREPLFPPGCIDDDQLHRPWVVLSSDKNTDPDWILASFALDNLMHRACHVAFKAYQLRLQCPHRSQRQIEMWTQGLLVEHALWITRRIIVQSEELERKMNADLPAQSGTRFLDHPPLHIHNRFYGNILSAWRAIYIFIDLIANPEIGCVEGSKRHKQAIEILRTYAALGRGDVFPLGKVITIFLTGVALGGKRRSPREVEWVYENVTGPLQGYLPLNRTAVASYHLLWEGEGDFWEAMERLNAAMSSDSML